MKTRGLVAVLLLLTGLQSALAQKLKLYFPDKQVVEYSVEKVDSLVFTGGAGDTAETHEWVDLGLPSGTLWATCNVGANSPEDWGDYFAWGETEPKTDYSWSTYKYCKGSYDTMTKYCTSSKYGTVDSKTELEPSDDAATANWGSGWQMPSEEQLRELYNSTYTSKESIIMNGVYALYGEKITSKSNGNSIFLPAAGNRYSTNHNDASRNGYYWSRSLSTSGSCGAYYLDFYPADLYTTYYYRYYGRSVRPVRTNSAQTTAQKIVLYMEGNQTIECNVSELDSIVFVDTEVQAITVSNIELSQTELSVKVGETTQLSATVLPDNATNKNLKWASSNTEIATVDETGKVVAVAVGTCTIICSATDGSDVTAASQVKVQPIVVTSIELNHTEDSVKVGETLQLSATVLPMNATNKKVKWASSNADVATVDETGKVVAVAVGTCTITCSATDGSGVKAECKVTVFEDNSGTIDGRDYVDLGLPSGTLWATCNVGANSPEEYGDYFAWGETEPKNDYSWSTYKYCGFLFDTMTKYCTNSDYGTVDNKTELEPSDDAATVNWGSNWQMPSLEQCEELINSNYTTTTWTTMNGKNGRKITSKSNGNSIFLPAASWRYFTSLDDTGSDGDYWSRSLGTSNSNGAYYLGFNSSSIDADSRGRCCGQSVRPVRVKESINVSNIELSQTVLSVKAGETLQLSATVLPENATNKDVKWACSNSDVATVDETGKVVAVAVGTCTITCSATDGSGVKAECQVTVSEFHEYIDLGLPSGTLWATCNVGANSPEEYGDYFAWGETEPKNDYSWSTYKYYKETIGFTKYCTDSYGGTVDNKTELEPSDDAATANWGSECQMPSIEQCRELINSSYTTKTWTTMNGVKGVKITSKSNGNSIFFPAAGYCYGTSLYEAGSYGSFWSRSLDTSKSYSYSACLYFRSSGVSTASDYRRYGRSVRPVRVKN